MAKYIQLNWTKVSSYYESNLVILNSNASVQIEISERDVEVNYLLSLTGEKFASFFHDYFAELHINEIPLHGHGQVVKFRVNKLPDYAVVIGDDVEHGGEVNPDDPTDILEGFAGSEGEYFRDKNSEIFAGIPA